MSTFEKRLMIATGLIGAGACAIATVWVVAVIVKAVALWALGG